MLTGTHKVAWELVPVIKAFLETEAEGAIHDCIQLHRGRGLDDMKPSLKTERNPRAEDNLPLAGQISGTDNKQTKFLYDRFHTFPIVSGSYRGATC